jgi:hypothetical protein
MPDPMQTTGSTRRCFRLKVAIDVHDGCALLAKARKVWRDSGGEDPVHAVRCIQDALMLLLDPPLPQPGSGYRILESRILETRLPGAPRAKRKPKPAEPAS